MAPSSAAKSNGFIGDLEPYQEAFADETDHRYVGFVSGVGAGKTYAGIARTVANMVGWNAGEMGAIVAPARRMIIDVIIPEMRTMGLFDAPFNWDYNSAYADQPGIHTPEGSRALLLSADNSKTIERLAGLNLSWSWLDESARIDPRAREILMQRLRVGNYRNLYVTTTPKGRNHTYQFFADDVPKVDSYDGAGTMYADDTTLSIVGVPTSANRELPEDYTTAMQADMPDEIRAQEIEGQFVEIGSGVFHPEMLTFVPPDDVNPEWEYRTIIGVDPAVQADEHAARKQDSDYWGVVVLNVPAHKNIIYVVETARRRGMTLNEGCSWIQQIINSSSNEPAVIVESNQSQRFLKQSLADAGVNAFPEYTTRNKEERLMDLAIPLEQSTIKFVDWNADDPETEHPFQELQTELLSFPEGSHDDLLDALHLAVTNAPVNLGGTLFSMDPYAEDKQAWGQE